MKKKILIGIVAFFLIVVSAVGVYFFYPEPAVYPNLPKHTEAEKQVFLDRISGANKSLESAELTDKGKFNLTMQIGFNEYALGNYNEAESAYKSATEMKVDNNYVAYVALYQLYLDIRKNRSAEKAIQKALSLSPTNADLWNKYIILEKERFYANSETLDKLYKEAIETTFYNVDILTTYATFLGDEKRYAEAITYWEKAITYNSDGKAEYQTEIDKLSSLIVK